MNHLPLKVSLKILLRWLMLVGIRIAIWIVSEACVRPHGSCLCLTLFLDGCGRLEAWRRLTQRRGFIVAIGKLRAGKTTLGFNNWVLILSHTIGMAGERERERE